MFDFISGSDIGKVPWSWEFWVLGFGVWVCGLGCGVWGLWFEIWGLKFCGVMFGVRGLEFQEMVRGLKCMIWIWPGIQGIPDLPKCLSHWHVLLENSPMIQFLRIRVSRGLQIRIFSHHEAPFSQSQLSEPDEPVFSDNFLSRGH